MIRGLSRSRHVFLSVATAAVLASVVSACGDDESSGGGPSVGMMSLANDPLFVSYEKGAQERADELGVDLKIDRVTQLDPTNFISTLNAAAATNPDAVLGAAFDAEAMQATFERLAGRGIR